MGNPVFREKRNNSVEVEDIQVNNTQSNIITFPLYYFDGINEFKKLVHDLKEDLDAIMGETRIIFATRKGKSIGNTVVKNRGLCIEPNAESPNQK